MQTFNAANIGAQLNQQLITFKSLIADEGSGLAKTIQNQLEQDLQAHQAESALRLAFIGQYSAGKSTIISALTGRRDIYIDADIATDKTTVYNWNGIQVIDTPGLFTDRLDHDQITYAEIDKSDLLVFCLTYMLFDNITIENFKKLAYDRGYGWKMMLVINKMADEGTQDEAQQIQNYRESLAAALAPHPLDDFPVCFIDAKDYCEGVDGDEDDLVELSRFESFIDALNKFVKQRGAQARLDTPIRMTLAATHAALPLFTPNDRDTSDFLESLNRLYNRVERERERLRTQIKSFKLGLQRSITREGDPLIDVVDIELTEEKWQALAKQAEINCEHNGQQAEAELERLLRQAETSLKSGVQEIMDSNLIQNFLVRLKAGNQSFKGVLTNSKNCTDFQTPVHFSKSLKFIADMVGAAAQGPKFAGQAAGQASGFFLRSGQVTNSGLHQAVYGVGKFVGFKFKPWQAVGIAKNIGNASKIIGPLGILLAIGFQVWEEHEQKKQDEASQALRRNIRKGFLDAADQYSRLIDQQLTEFEQQTYDKVLTEITQQRDLTTGQLATTDKRLKALSTIQTQLQTLLSQSSF